MHLPAAKSDFIAGLPQGRMKNIPRMVQPDWAAKRQVADQNVFSALMKHCCTSVVHFFSNLIPKNK
jgi:hypothetical protein